MRRATPPPVLIGCYSSRDVGCLSLLILHHGSSTLASTHTHTHRSPLPCCAHIAAQTQSAWCGGSVLKQALKYSPFATHTHTHSLPSCANLFHLEVDFIISFELRPDREVNHFDRPCLKPLQPKPLILSIFGAKGGEEKVIVGTLWLRCKPWGDLQGASALIG